MVRSLRMEYEERKRCQVRLSPLGGEGSPEVLAVHLLRYSSGGLRRNQFWTSSHIF